MKVVKVTPQGYCYGVVRAINIARKAASNTNENIYILGDIVHNEFVSNALKEINLQTIENKNQSRLELLDNIDSGTVIFTAHGVSDKVRQKALSKNLNIIDATCPEVAETQEIIKQMIAQNYHIIFIGKKNHPEAEACSQLDSKNIDLITSIEEANNLEIEDKKYFITYQSTLNILEVIRITEVLEQKLVNHIYVHHNSICDATSSRQNAVSTIKDVDFFYIVGDMNSNNSNKLVERAKTDVGVEAKLISNISDIKLSDLENVETIAVSSGASTPPELTAYIISYLEQLSLSDKSTHQYPDFEISQMKILQKK